MNDEAGNRRHVKEKSVNDAYILTNKPYVTILISDKMSHMFIYLTILVSYIHCKNLKKTFDPLICDVLCILG